MQKKKTPLALLMFIFFIACLTSYGQNIIKGKVLDKANSLELLGANIIIVGTATGTLTDENGEFQLTTDTTFPFTIAISYIGYVTQEIVVNSVNQDVTVFLAEDSMTLDQVVITASKIEESIIEAPVTIEKLGIAQLRNSPSPDAYGAIANLKGVQANTGSLTFTSVNTRGFADMQNWRFVQLLDGMDASAPGLNYPLGGNSGPADIDIASIELVPGASSALYGANAFNGLLSIKTKSPFDHTGISAYMKGGSTEQDAGGSNPYVSFGIRAAHVFNDKWAVKFNFGLLEATDWTANDDTYYISNTRVADKDALLATPRNDPNFDAVNVYGDEVGVPVNLGTSTPTIINRSGIKEEDIVDYDVELVKFDGSLHYKITDKIEASYGFRHIKSDGILRHTTIYPLVNFTQQFHRLGIEADNFNVKAFYSLENAQDSYALLATGPFIQENRKSSALWSADYGAAFRNEISGVTGGSHDAARIYADRDQIPIGSPAFNAIRNATLNNSDITTGGSKFIDQSTLFSTDGNYDFKNEIDIFDLQIGGSYREYKLDSEGQLFNDGPLGFAKPIKIGEYGFYTQLGKKLFDERLSLRGSLRYDKNENFDGKWTPRLSAVFSIDEDKTHNIRASYQQGFRNPASQEAYIALNLRNFTPPATPPITLIGGLEDNIANYNVQDIITGNLVNGLEIHDNLINPTTGMPLNLSFLKQEKNTTYEIGYKTLINKRLFIDLNVYHTEYEDLVARVTGFSSQATRVFLVYTNISDEVTSDGAGLGVEYLFEGGYRAGVNYTYTTFDADDAVANNPGFLPSFNTPENRFNLSLSNSNIADSNFGFDIKYRWSEAYQWQSPFGQGDIDDISTVDLALLYKIKSLKSQVKIGATNLLQNEYKTVYGGPEVGSLYFLSWTFDKVFGY